MFCLKRGTKKEKPFLDLDYVGDYSSKIKKIIEYLKISKGPIIVYSKYIPASLLPLALAMEQNGFQRFLTKGEQPLLNYSPNSKGGGGISPPIYYKDGTPAPQYKGKDPFKPAKYAIVTSQSPPWDF